jgi:hypothetical protein
MIYDYRASVKEKRDIQERYGLVVITHGEFAGRFGYYDDDDAGSKKAIVYLYRSDFRLLDIRTKECYIFVNYSHFARVELNERCFEHVVSPYDDRTYGWDRWEDYKMAGDSTK